MARKREDKNPRGVCERLIRCKPCQGEACASCGGAPPPKKPCPSCHKACRGTGRTGWGVWWVRYADDQGKEHREKVGAKGAALEVYHKRKTQVREGVFFPEAVGKGSKVPGLAEAITEHFQAHCRDKASWRDLRRRGDLWREALGDKRLDDITPKDVEAAMSGWRGTCSEQTLLHRLNYLNHLFSIAVRDGTVKANPVAPVNRPKVDNARVRWLRGPEEDTPTSKSEETRLREALPAWAWPIVNLAMLTGMRRGEIFALRWERVDLPRRLARIPKTKNGEARHVHLNSEAVDLLRDLPSRGESEWVFPSRTGKTPMDGHNFATRVFAPATEKAKVSDFHFHDLRHTFCSRLVMAGAPLNTVRELAGHKTLAMTQRYAHLSPDHLSDAVELLSRKHVVPSESAPESAPRRKQQRPPRS